MKNYITREGAERLRKRLVDLREDRRILTDQTQDPNANPALKRLELECQKLESILESAIIADPPADQDKIALGAWVRVRDEVGEEESLQIVGADEANPEEGRISSASPLGRVLLTKRAGEMVNFETPAGRRELTILGVRYGGAPYPD